MACVAAVSAGICGSLAALLVARRDVVEGLRRGATPPPRELMLRRMFVAGEVALAFVLLVSVTLLGQSLIRALRIDPGFDADGVLTLQVSVPAASYADSERVSSFYSALQDALEQRLGARAASIVNEIPLTGDGGRRLVGVGPAEAAQEAVVRETGSAYFDVMRIPIAAGRSFDLRDDASAPPRVVVSELLARRLFALEPAIGRPIRLASTAQAAEIIGVVGDVRHHALDEIPSPMVYLSASQSPSRNNIVVVRSARPDADVTAIVRKEVARLDRELPVYRTRSMRDVVEASPGCPPAGC
jgi:putative ABC transport system permease protein